MTQRTNKKQHVETTNHLIILSIPNQQAGFPHPSNNGSDLLND